MPSNLTHCAALVRAADHDRYLATLFAPAEAREALFALDAFNIEISRVRDVAREPMPGEIRLQWWREVLEGQRDGEAQAHPVAAALRETLSRYAIAPARLVALIDAHQFDLYDEPMATLDDFDRYATLTQSVVFALAGEILGGQGDSVATLTRPAGIAYAAVTVLLDFARHSARGQVFVPLELMERHGVKREDLFAGRAGAPLNAALADWRQHARRALAAAAAAAGAVKPEILPALLPVATLGPTLRRLEQRGNQPFQAEPLSRLRRQWLIWRAARDPRRVFS